MTDRYGNPGTGFGASAVSGMSNLPLDWEHPTQWSQLEKYFEPVFREATKKIISSLMENSKSLEDFLAGTVYKVGGGPLYGNVSISGSLTVDGVPYYAFPPGSIMQYAGASAPPGGWLLCDGTAYQESSYSLLYGALGSTYNTHCGASAPAAGYFRVPNYSGRVLVAKNSSDSDFNDLTDYGGTKSVTLTAAQSGLPSHKHSITDPGHKHSQNEASTTGLMANAVDLPVTYSYPHTGAGVFDTATASTGITETNNVAAADASESHTNLQPYAVVNYIIKY